jgi:peptidoglycan/xylan/chitin deacetylase (PgdA/CDA1 family)
MGLTRREFLKLGCAAAAGVSFPAVALAGRSPRVPVLLYHDIADGYRDDYTISPALFAAQLEWLYEAGYRSVTWRDLAVPGSLPERAVIITFDDGYASFLDFAYPLLEGYRFHATVNIIGEWVGGVIAEGGNRPLLSWDEYRFLAASGRVTLGCHTYGLHHRGGVLRVSTGELERDLARFQEAIRRETGGSAEVLAWPYGIYDRERAEVAERAGFRYVLTSNEGFVGRESRLSAIPRININDRIDLISFRQYLGETV